MMTASMTAAQTVSQWIAQICGSDITHLTGVALGDEQVVQ